MDSFAYDPHKYAMDYHGIGFRECVAEVVRYLERIEGLDVQNPLRLRLTSHLQCCAAQRELATKQPTPQTWGYSATTPSSHQPYPPINTLPLSPSNHGPSIATNLNPHQSSLHHPHQNTMHDLGHFDVSTSCTQTTVPPSTSDRLSSSSTTAILTPLTTTTSSALAAYSPHHQHPSVNTFTIPTSSHHQNYNHQSNISTQGMKPYRPWGAEVAY